MIPEIEALPQKQRILFDNTYHDSLSRGNTEAASMRIAFETLVASKVEMVAATAGAENAVFFTADATPADELVSRTKEGNVVHTYILSDIHPDEKGTSPSPELLAKWADTLNKNRPEIDADHELWDAAIRSNNGDVEMVSRAMQFKKGIAKIIGAVVDAGRLVVRVMFSQHYENYISRIKGLSIEAAVTKKDGSTWTDGKIFGATFAVNANPVNPRAVRVAA